MADVELVIKIPENVYYDTFQYVESLASSDFELLMMRAVKNGTPLPKGHGRLMDETDLKTLFGLDDRLWWSNAVEEFTNLPTIIDADKKENNLNILKEKNGGIPWQSKIEKHIKSKESEEK